MTGRSFDATRAGGVGATVVSVGVALVLVVLGGVSPASARAVTCNGKARLCDRPLGSVAFPTAHNAMSSTVDGFIGPNQGETIAQQLERGIRGFQIDAFTGAARRGRVYTELSGPFGSQKTDLPPALVRQAARIHEAIGAPPAGTPTHVYLCHSFCELGAIRMKTMTAAVRKFLDSHPRVVLAFVIEDYVPPERLLTELDEAGLGRELLTVTPGAELPTLGEMIRAHTRLLVMLENGDGGQRLPNAFSGLVQETPFTFARPSGLDARTSCAPNRGQASAPIFQLNHWVTPPSLRRAQAVNYRRLRERVDRCEDERQRVPTLVAVDFAEKSSVVRIADRINGARRSP